MPTPSGLPKKGETWRKTSRLPPDWEPYTVIFKVLERSRGDYWSMRVQVTSVNGEPPSGRARYQLWVDCAWWLSRGELEYVHS